MVETHNRSLEYRIVKGYFASYRLYNIGYSQVFTVMRSNAEDNDCIVILSEADPYMDVGY